MLKQTRTPGEKDESIRAAIIANSKENIDNLSRETQLTRLNQKKLMSFIAWTTAFYSSSLFFFMGEAGGHKIIDHFNIENQHMKNALFASSIEASICYFAFSQSAFNNPKLAPKNTAEKIFSIFSPAAATPFFTATYIGAKQYHCPDGLAIFLGLSA